MDVLAASEKNMSALRKAAQLGGISLKSGTTTSTFNETFREAYFEYIPPFHLSIQRKTVDDTVKEYLSISSGLITLYDGNQKNNWIMGMNELSSTIATLDLLGSDGEHEPPSAGVWDVMIGVNVNEVSDPQYPGQMPEPPKFFFIYEDQRNNYIKDYRYIPCTKGFYSTCVGRIEKFPLSSSLDVGNFYWTVKDQFVTNNIEIFMPEVRKSFAINAHWDRTFQYCPGLNPPEPSHEFGRETFSFFIRPGLIYFKNNTIVAEGAFLSGSRISGSFYDAYAQLDTKNLSATTFFIDRDSASGQILPLYGGEMIQYHLGSVVSDWGSEGSVYNLAIVQNIDQSIFAQFAPPSGQTFIYGNDYNFETVPMSAGFIEITSSYVDPQVPASGYVYTPEFIESRTCENNEEE